MSKGYTDRRKALAHIAVNISPSIHQTKTTMNTLPESIKKRIEDEAEAATREREKTMKEAKRIPFSSEYCDGWADGYEEAANKIIGNPGDYGLAGAWQCAYDQIPDKEYIGRYFTLLGRVSKTDSGLIRFQAENSNSWTNWEPGHKELKDLYYLSESVNENESAEHNLQIARNHLKKILTRIETSGSDQGQALFEISEMAYEGLMNTVKSTTPSDRVQQLEQYKKLLRIAGVPELLIENPGLIGSQQISEADREWAENAIAEYEQKSKPPFPPTGSNQE
jgi:hypothetical protein